MKASDCRSGEHAAAAKTYRAAAEAAERRLQQCRSSDRMDAQRGGLRQLRHIKSRLTQQEISRSILNWCAAAKRDELSMRVTLSPSGAQVAHNGESVRFQLMQQSHDQADIMKGLVLCEVGKVEREWQDRLKQAELEHSAQTGVLQLRTIKLEAELTQLEVELQTSAVKQQQWEEFRKQQIADADAAQKHDALEAAVLELASQQEMLDDTHVTALKVQP
jgi:hypothetical protein